MGETSNLFRSAAIARSLAERIFSQYPQTKESLKWLKNNVQEFNTRITDFDAVVTRLNEILPDPSSANELYRQEISELVKFTGHISSLPEAETETNSKFTSHSPALRAYFQGKREFQWADEEFDPKRPAKSAMGIFLEGYGKYLYAFEAVLLAEHPTSKLLGDIQDWMKADASNFSAPTQALLKSL